MPGPIQPLAPIHLQPSPRNQQVEGFSMGVTQQSSSFPPYDTDYDAPLALPYLQLPSPPNQQYNNISVDYFASSREYPPNQYPC